MNDNEVVVVSKLHLSTAQCYIRPGPLSHFVVAASFEFCQTSSLLEIVLTLNTQTE